MAAAAPSLPPGRQVALPGRGRTFIREVAGPPGAPTVVLLHGWTANSDLNWFPSYAPLGRHFNVVAMDHRGHGGGIRSRRPFRLEACADDVAALCSVLGLSDVIVVGYSMGGPVAQLTWRRHRALVSGLVLCATSRTFGQGTGDRTITTSLLALSAAVRLTPGPLRREAMARVMRGRLDGTPIGAWAAAELQRSDPATLVAAGSALIGFDSRPWIGEVDVPAAVVVTTRDGLVSPHRQLALAESIPGAAVHRVVGDHGVCVNNPGRFVPTLVSACLDVAGRSSGSRRSA